MSGSIFGCTEKKKRCTRIYYVIIINDLMLKGRGENGGDAKYYERKKKSNYRLHCEARAIL